MHARTVLAFAALLALTSACSSPPYAPGEPSEEGGDTPADTNEPSKPGTEKKGTGPAAPAAGAIDLGTVNAGSEVTFDVPAGTLGFTIIVDAQITNDDFLGVQELRDPTGTVVVRDFLDASAPGRSLTGWQGAGAAALRLPLVNDSATSAVKAGKWTARIGGSTAAPNGVKGSTTPLQGRVHGAVRLQTSNGGAIDLDLYVPDGLEIDDNTVTAASAPADAGMKTRLDLVFGLFKRLYDLDRGDVRYHPVAASIASLSGQQEIDDANTLATAVGARPSAQVILTNRLSPDPEGEISGISNCLPGAVGLPGTVCSAVIVSLRSSAPAWQDAATMVHELGHFAGLEHTTEFGGDFDSLGDTPKCTNTAKSSLASCPDHDNLMFPSVDLASAESSIAVSETQRAVMRSSSLYRAK